MRQNRAAFMLTVAMRDRALYQRHFTQEYGDTAVNERSRLVSSEADPSLPTGSCRVLVRLRGGAELEATCTDEAEFLFSWEDTVRLVRRLASELAISDASERIERLRAMVDSIEEHNDVSDLMSLCTVA